MKTEQIRPGGKAEKGCAPSVDPVSQDGKRELPTVGQAQTGCVAGHTKSYWRKSPLKKAT